MSYPDVIPMIAYEDGPAAMDWLAKAFGFRERARMIGQDGRLSHGEMETGSGVIMIRAEGDAMGLYPQATVAPADKAKADPNSLILLI